MIAEENYTPQSCIKQILNFKLYILVKSKNSSQKYYVDLAHSTEEKIEFVNFKKYLTPEQILQYIVKNKDGFDVVKNLKEDIMLSAGYLMKDLPNNIEIDVKAVPTIAITNDDDLFQRVYTVVLISPTKGPYFLCRAATLKPDPSIGTVLTETIDFYPEGSIDPLPICYLSKEPDIEDIYDLLATNEDMQKLIIYDTMLEENATTLMEFGEFRVYEVNRLMVVSLVDNIKSLKTSMNHNNPHKENLNKILNLNYFPLLANLILYSWIRSSEETNEIELFINNEMNENLTRAFQEFKKITNINTLNSEHFYENLKISNSTQDLKMYLNRALGVLNFTLKTSSSNLLVDVPYMEATISTLNRTKKFIEEKLNESKTNVEKNNPYTEVAELPF